MQQRFLTIIILCLALMPCVASAQDAQDFDEQELVNALLADIGVTEMELMQFIVKMNSLAEPYQQQIDEYMEPFENPTRDNYAELTSVYFDQVLSPMINDVKAAAIDSFSEDGYSKMTLRFYQIAENFPDVFQGNHVDMGGLLQLFLLPDVVPMTEEQLADLVALQKEVVTEIVGIDTIMKEKNAELFAEQKALHEELQEAETDEERTAINEKLSKVMQETAALMKEPVQKMFAESKNKLAAMLTAEQKTRLAQIKQDMPDYLKKALAHLQARIDESEGTAAWRPGINSWMPGQGAPKDRTGHPGEARPEKTPKERAFPE